MYTAGLTEGLYTSLGGLEAEWRQGNTILLEAWSSCLSVLESRIHMTMSGEG